MELRRTSSFITTTLVCVSVLLPLFASSSVALRIYLRTITSTKKVRADDWLILLSLALCWAHSINIWVASSLIGVNHSSLAPTLYACSALRTLWIAGFLEVTVLATVKLGILAFFNHIFYVSKNFRISVHIMMGIIIAWWISSFMCELLATDPISGSWDATKAHIRFNFDIWFITHSGMSIFFDVLVLCFPLPMIGRLQINVQQKLSIIGIFWLGAFCCVAAGIRFYHLYSELFTLVLQEDKYTSVTRAFIWGSVEPNCSIIASCLPTYGPLFRKDRARAGILRPIRYLFGLLSKTPSNTSRNPSEKREYQEIVLSEMA